MTEQGSGVRGVSWVLCMAICCGVSGTGSPGALAQGAKANGDSTAPRISVQDAHGAVVADSGKAGSVSSSLEFEREYQSGDRIVVSGPQRMAVRVDDMMPECLVYVADPAKARFSFDIPYGEGEAATRSPFAKDAFAGRWHRLSARALTSQELTGYRNLAVNACDAELESPATLGTKEEKAAEVFPHASTNSASRSLPDFRARNAIDGVTMNGHHSVWPYQSWGPQLRDDLWWKVDFGRAVEVDKLRLMVRSDFPHDSYWKSGVIEFSDGTSVPIEIKETGTMQEFAFPKRKVAWMRLNKLVAADPARWCALMEVEAWGRDLK